MIALCWVLSFVLWWLLESSSLIRRKEAVLFKSILQSHYVTYLHIKMYLILGSLRCSHIDMYIVNTEGIFSKCKSSLNLPTFWLRVSVWHSLLGSECHIYAAERLLRDHESQNPRTLEEMNDFFQAGKTPTVTLASFLQCDFYLCSYSHKVSGLSSFQILWHVKL